MKREEIVPNDSIFCFYVCLSVFLVLVCVSLCLLEFVCVIDTRRKVESKEGS